MEHCYLSFSLAFGGPSTSMTTSLRTALDLPMNKYKVLALAFIALFLNEGHAAQKNHCNLYVMANSSDEELGGVPRENIPLQ